MSENLNLMVSNLIQTVSDHTAVVGIRRNESVKYPSLLWNNCCRTLLHLVGCECEGKVADFNPILTFHHCYWLRWLSVCGGWVLLRLVV